MRRLLLSVAPILLCLIATPAFADDRSACIMAVAAHLPRVPGLQITSSDARALTMAESAKRVVRSMFVVTIDFTAAGQKMQSTAKCEMSINDAVGPVITRWPPG